MQLLLYAYRINVTRKMDRYYSVLISVFILAIYRTLFTEKPYQKGILFYISIKTSLMKFYVWYISKYVYIN